MVRSLLVALPLLFAPLVVLAEPPPERGEAAAKGPRSGERPSVTPPAKPSPEPANDRAALRAELRRELAALRRARRERPPGERGGPGDGRVERGAAPRREWQAEQRREVREWLRRRHH